MRDTVKTSARLAARGVAASALMLALAACAMNGETNPAEGIGFREARFAEVSAMQSFRDCRDQALDLDAQARAGGDAAKYLASARLVEKCEADIGSGASVAMEERMQAYALGIQNYLRGGDVQSARNNLGRFRQAFAGYDLYFADGSSFTDTMSLLVGEAEPTAAGELSMANVNAETKAEIRRMRFWLRN